jgi:MSHA pilin protein MshA
MKKAQGFTLIELIIVIVILGILAVTAAPKFIDVQSDAELSVAQAIEGSIVSANNMIHAKALIQSVSDTANQTVSVNGGTVRVDFQYPETSATGIGAAIDLPTGWSVAYTDTTATYTKGVCSVVYTGATSAAGQGSITTAAECDA